MSFPPRRVASNSKQAERPMSVSDVQPECKPQEELAGDILGRKNRKKAGRRGGGVRGGQREGESAGETL